MHDYITPRAVDLFAAWHADLKAGRLDGTADDYDSLGKELQIKPWEMDPRQTHGHPAPSSAEWKAARQLYVALCAAAGIEVDDG